MSDTVTDSQCDAPARAAVLEVRAVRKAFAIGSQRIEVLRGLDFRLEAGSFVSIRGESGSGKSTLLNILSGLERVDSGEVHWDGQRIDTLGNAAMAARRGRSLGMVFQSYQLIQELTVLENVMLAARIAGLPLQPARTRALELLGHLGLGERLLSIPSRLSGGERQRVAVARALLNEPKVLLADEPTGNLDERTAEVVMAELEQICRARGAALLLVTHNPEFAARASVRWRLHEGILHND